MIFRSLGLWLSTLSFLCACNAGSAARAPLEIVIALDSAGRCSIHIDGQKMNDNELLQKLAERPSGQEVVLKGGAEDVPYRCIGSTIYTMQRAGVPLKAGFIYGSGESDQN